MNETIAPVRRVNPRSGLGARALVLSSIVLATASACTLKPPGPVVTTVPVPSAPEGTPIEVSTMTTNELEAVEKKSETCPQGHATGSPDCIVTYYTVQEPVKRTKTTMTYGGQRLTHAQFLTLAEVDRTQKIATLEDKTAQCKRARVPRYVAIALGVGAGAALGYAIATQNKVGTYVGIGLGAGALTAAGVGFGMSRGSCQTAQNLARELDLTHKDETVVRGPSNATKIDALADEYNAR